jgi:hypothetical protein
MTAPSSATPSSPMTTGGYVQYNPTVQSPLAPPPSAPEETIGIVRQLFSAQGKQYAQVVWNPGSARPQTGLYTADQLCPISQQQAVDLTNQMNEGTYQPPTGAPSSNYQQPTVPTLALPPALQGAQVTPTLTGSTNQPLSPGAGYQ